MIPYHGLPIWPATAAVDGVGNGHAFVSYRRPEQLSLAVEVAQSIAIDNGAFSAWSAGEAVTDWGPFYAWVDDVRRIPSVDFIVIPDVIDGSEADNDALLAEWPFGKFVGAPVWHMHESLERLVRLVSEYPRVCIGSSGEFSRVGSPAWWTRMRVAMLVVCDPLGRPNCKLHGLRMLNPEVYSRLPLASADSTNLARNIPIDSRWKGTYQPPATNKSARAQVLRARIENLNSPQVWDFTQ